MYMYMYMYIYMYTYLEREREGEIGILGVQFEGLESLIRKHGVMCETIGEPIAFLRNCTYAGIQGPRVWKKSQDTSF